MSSPFSKSRCGAHRLHRHGCNLNFILAFGLGCFTAVTTLFALPESAADKRSVLVLTQGNGRQQSFIEFTAGLQQNLATNFHSPVVVYIENLDLQHFNSPDYRRGIIEWLRVKYQGCKLDAIVTENEQTADMTFKVRVELWPQVPLVFVDSGRMKVADIEAQTNFTSISAYPDMQNTLEAALRLCPDTRRIAFVSSIGNGYVELYRRDLKQLEDFATNRFEVIKLIGLTMAETKQRLSTLPPRTIVFYNGIWMDAAGQSFTTPDALEELSPSCTAPIFSCADTHIGHGAVGGSCRVYYIMGVETAGQVAAVIRAGSASSVPAVQSASSRFIFDWRQLRRHGLDKKNLPHGSEVRFRPPTLWGMYYDIMIIVVVALVVQTGLIAALLLQRRRKRQTEAELFHSQQMLQTVLDTIPQRVFWKDRNSVFLGCNKPLAEDCGFSDASKLVGKTDYDTVGAPMADRYRADDREVMEMNQAKLNYEETQNKPDGGTGWLRTNKAPLHDKDGRVIGVLGTYEDITKRKQAEEALRESEQRFRSLLDNAPDAVYVQTKERIAYVNRATLQLLRAERPEQLLGQRVLDLVAPEWREIVRKLIQQVNTQAGPVPAIEEKYLRMDNSQVEVEVTAVPVVFHGNHGALVFVRDITERKRAEKALWESQAFYHSLVEQLPAGVFRKDPEGRYVFVSPWFCRLKGMKEEAFLGKTPQEVAASEAAKPDATEQAIKYAAEGADHHVQIMQTGNPIELVEEYTYADGRKQFMHVIKIPVFNSEGKVIGTQGVLFDITDRKRMEEALRWSETQLQATLEATADGILAVDNKGRVIKANQRFADLWRVPQSLMEGGDDKTLLDFVLDQLSDPDTFLKKVQALYKSDAIDMDTLTFKDGRVFERYSSPMIMEGGIIGRVWSFRDITEQKGLQEKLLQSQKMEAIGKLTAGIAHEFNNLLTAILGYSNLVLARLPSDSPLRRDLEQMELASNRAVALTRQLLTFGRKYPQELKSINLNTIVLDMQLMLQPLLGATIRLTASLDPALGIVIADPTQMGQIIMNMTVNARDAMPHGGELTIATANVHLDKDLARRHPESAPGSYIRLTVSDTGVGMSDDVKARLFDPFFTTKGVGQGTGLGLATCIGIIKQTGGFIDVDSAPGKGTTFQIFLPQADAAAMAAFAAGATRPGNP